MTDHSGLLRTDLATKLVGLIPAEQMELVVGALSSVMTGYNVEKKTTDLITTNGVPEIVKYFIASKALENLSERTINLYMGVLKNFFLSIRKSVSDIGANDIRAYVFDLRTARKLAPSTIQLYQRVLSSLFGWMHDNDYIERDPTRKVEKIKVEEKRLLPMTPVELEIVRYSCTTIRDKALVDFLFSTGCRVSECCNVMKTDIDWSQQSVMIRHGKGAKDRIVYFNAESEVSLKCYLDSRSDDSPYLFVSDHLRDKRKLSTRSIEMAIKKIVTRSGIGKKFTPHTFRRTFATVGIRTGMPLERVQALMGHSKPETTMIYARLDETDLKSAYRQSFV